MFRPERDSRRFDSGRRAKLRGCGPSTPATSVGGVMWTWVIPPGVTKETAQTSVGWAWRSAASTLPVATLRPAIAASRASAKAFRVTEAVLLPLGTGVAPGGDGGHVGDGRTGRAGRPAEGLVHQGGIAGQGHQHEGRRAGAAEP